MDEPVFMHPQTEADVRRSITARRQALLLSGPTGSDKSSVARWMAARLLEIPVSKLATSAFLLEVHPLTDKVSIEQVRELKRYTSLKTTGSSLIRRAIIIHQADTMTIEAQNAILKLLEEPPADTVILMTTSAERKLLPTINSRAETIIIRPLSWGHIRKLYGARYQENDLRRAYMISGGKAGLLKALLDKNEQHPALVNIETAKRLLRADTYGRLLEIEALSKEKGAAVKAVEGLKVVSLSALKQAAGKEDSKEVEAWHRRVAAIQAAEGSLQLNANVKLVLTDLLSNL